MTSEVRCDEAPSTVDDDYVQLPRRVAEQMTEICRLFLITASHLVQPASTDSHATQTDDMTLHDQQQQHAVDNCSSTDTDSLKKVLRELVAKNVSWQTLCNDKQSEIQQLKKRLKPEHDTNCQQLCTASTFTSTTDEQMLDGGQRQQLEQTVKSLTDSLADKQSTIDMLQLQVVIYREDFQSEREDRERAQSQLNDLQLELRQSQQPRRTDTQANHSRVDYFTRLPQGRGAYVC